MTVPLCGRSSTGCGQTHRCWKNLARSIAMRLESRVGQRRDSRLLDRSHAPASSRAIGHVRSGPTRRRSRDLGSHHFVIRARRPRFFLFDFLAYERELTGKTFTTLLTSPNPNKHMKLFSCVDFPFTDANDCPNAQRPLLGSPSSSKRTAVVTVQKG